MVLEGEKKKLNKGWKLGHSKYIHIWMNLSRSHFKKFNIWKVKCILGFKCSQKTLCLVIDFSTRVHWTELYLIRCIRLNHIKIAILRLKKMPTGNFIQFNLKQKFSLYAYCQESPSRMAKRFHPGCRPWLSGRVEKDSEVVSSPCRKEQHGQFHLPRDQDMNARYLPSLVSCSEIQYSPLSSHQHTPATLKLGQVPPTCWNSKNFCLEFKNNLIEGNIMDPSKFPLLGWEETLFLGIRENSSIRYLYCGG